MKLLSTLITFTAMTLGLTIAQDAPPPAIPELPQKQPVDPKEAAMEQLFTTMGSKDFTAAIEQAKKADIHPQVILEARFLHLVDLRDNTGLAAMAPELLAQKDAFDPDSSEIFSVKEDWLAIIHYTQALAALEKKDNAGFKKHITEAFWLSPRQGQAFAPHIDQLRLDEAMAAITLKRDRVLQAQDGGKATTLGELMTGSKATLLHFWSPMSQEVQVNLPDFVSTSKSCKEQNIAVASILVGAYPTLRDDAETIRKEDANEAACVWLVDSQKESLASLMRVSNIPTMVVISPEGKVLFNGHPSNKKFWDTLQKVAPEFKRPNNLDKKKHNDHNHVHGDG